MVGSVSAMARVLIKVSLVSGEENVRILEQEAASRAHFMPGPSEGLRPAALTLACDWVT